MSVLDTSAILIGSLVTHILNELVEKVAIGSVELNAIEISSHGILSSPNVIFDRALDVLRRHLLRGCASLKGNGAGVIDHEPVLFRSQRLGSSSGCHELEIRETTFLANCFITCQSTEMLGRDYEP